MFIKQYSIFVCFDLDKDNRLTRNFLGFSVYLSNTTNREDGILCFRDTSYTRATIPNPVTIPCPHYGRFVIYYNNRTHPPYPEGYSNTTGSILCEVEVYGIRINYFHCMSPTFSGYFSLLFRLTFGYLLFCLVLKL